MARTTQSSTSFTTCFLFGGAKKRIQKQTSMKKTIILRANSLKKTKKISLRGKRELSSKETRQCRNSKIGAVLQEC